MKSSIQLFLMTTSKNQCTSPMLNTMGVTAIPPADLEGFENQWTLTWL